MQCHLQDLASIHDNLQVLVHLSGKVVFWTLDSEFSAKNMTGNQLPASPVAGPLRVSSGGLSPIRLAPEDTKLHTQLQSSLVELGKGPKNRAAIDRDVKRALTKVTYDVTTRANWDFNSDLHKARSLPTNIQAADDTVWLKDACDPTCTIIDGDGDGFYAYCGGLSRRPATLKPEGRPQRTPRPSRVASVPSCGPPRA